MIFRLIFSSHLFQDLEQVKEVSNVVIPDDWITGSDSLALKTGALILVAATVRGVVLWLLNLVLLVHMVRAVRILSREDQVRLGARHSQTHCKKIRTELCT